MSMNFSLKKILSGCLVMFHFLGLKHKMHFFSRTSVVNQIFNKFCVHVNKNHNFRKLTTEFENCTE